MVLLSLGAGWFHVPRLKTSIHVAAAGGGGCAWLLHARSRQGCWFHWRGPLGGRSIRTLDAQQRRIQLAAQAAGRRSAQLSDERDEAVKSTKAFADAVGSQVLPLLLMDMIIAAGGLMKVFSLLTTAPAHPCQC